MHEPILLDDGGGELLLNEVYTIEPGLYGRGDGGVRVEDMLVVHPVNPATLIDFIKVSTGSNDLSRCCTGVSRTDAVKRRWRTASAAFFQRKAPPERGASARLATKRFAYLFWPKKAAPRRRRRVRRSELADCL